MNNLKFRVDLDNVGIGSAAKAYGGFLEAYSFYDTTFDDWFQNFRNLILSKMGKEYLPIYRMADGEYRFIMGRKYNFHKRPLWRELTAVTAEKLRIKNPDKWKTSWGEEYSPLKVKTLREDLSKNIRYFSQKGKLACYFNENGLNAFVEYNKYLIPFFNSKNIKFDESNYIPFHFVCGLLVKNGWKEFYQDRNILVVTGSDKAIEQKIKETILGFGAANVQFIRISKTSSMEEVLDLSNLKPAKIDLCLVAAGIGSANILRQLEPLQTVILDIGGYMNCYINQCSSQHGGIFKLPEN